MRYIVFAIMVVLYWINNFIFNWGISIIILSILVRVVIHPIAKKQYGPNKSLQNFKISCNHNKEIKKNYKGGEQSERILNIYE